MTTGFEVINQQLWIDKDPEAQLIYTFDWAEWLPMGDSLAQVEYTIQARTNDPEPLVNESFGIVNSQTYIELSGGQLDKVYTVTAKVTTDNNLVDRRNFKVKIVNRSA